MKNIKLIFDIDTDLRSMFEVYIGGSLSTTVHNVWRNPGAIMYYLNAHPTAVVEYTARWYDLYESAYNKEHYVSKVFEGSTKGKEYAKANK